MEKRPSESWKLLYNCMSKKKILIVSRTIFPRRAPRAYRATELAIQLAKYGHDVSLYGVLGDYDYKSFEEQHRLKVKNVGKMRFATLNCQGETKNNLVTKLLTKVFRRLLDFPDIELMFKLPAVVKKEENVDLIITIAKPYSLHWGAALAKKIFPKKFPKVWIADCGDPYMGTLFQKPPFYFSYLEKWTFRKADFITIPFAGALEGYFSEFHNKIHVIPQGFNFDEVEEITEQKSEPNTTLTFAYAGTFYKDIRDPSLFLDYLSTLSTDFKFILYTHSKEILSPFLHRLRGKIEIRSYIPRIELLKVLHTVDFVVNFENGTSLQSPSKLIDYALIKKPILSLNSSSLEKELIDSFFRKDYRSSLEIDDIEQYNIKNVAMEFLNLAESKQPH